MTTTTRNNSCEKLVWSEKHTAFRYAYNFLFKDNTEIVRITEPYYKTMKKHNSLDNSDSLTIGIGIRVWEMVPLLQRKMFKNLLQSSHAQKIEQAYYYNLTTARPLWYVMADSLHVRKMSTSTE